MNANSLSPIDWAKRPLEKYADFSGRAPRSEYWWYALALFIANIVLSIIEGIVGIHHMILGLYGPLTSLLFLATIVPSLAVGARRLHDTNRTGWWLLMPIVPYVLAFVLGGAAMMGGAAAAGGAGALAGLGVAAVFLLLGAICAIVLLVFFVLPGTPGENRYGPNPLGESAATTAVAG
jgi:uncharacterized membrane protein YhaH (DUF805 family)